MADYSTIKGFTIQSLASDPYASEVLAGTWSSGNNVNTIRSQLGGCGLVTAGIIAAGNGVPALPATLDETEEYDGTSWAEKADLNSARESPGVGGTQSAALCVAGWNGSIYMTEVESWNGTSWTVSPAALNSGRTYNIVAGTSTAMITAGGGPGSLDLTEIWNGSTWTETNDLNTGRTYMAGAGISTSAILAGGGDPAPATTGKVETWDGTSWTEVSALARGATSSTRACMATNTPNATALFFGGSAPVVALTESWDGTAWTEVADMGAAKDFGAGGGGSGSSAFWATGKSSPGTKVNATEEFSAPSTASIAQEGQVWYNTTSTVLKGFSLAISSGAWSTANNRVTGTNSGAGAGDQSGMVTFGGNAAPGYSTSGITQTYDGTSWSVSPVSISPRYLMAGFGTSTAAICAGGATPITGATESFNGSAWTEVADLNNVASHTSGCGTSTAGIKTGGDVPAKSPNLSGDAETWDGTSWTEVTAFTSGRTNAATGGTQTSCLIMGGSQVPAHLGFVEEYNGTSWSEKADMSTDRSHFGCSAQGTTTSMIVFAGSLQPGAADQVKTEAFDGTTWTEVADVATANDYNVGGGTASAAINVAGAPTSVDTQTEEWNATGSTIKTFTAS